MRFHYTLITQETVMLDRLRHRCIVVS